MKKVVQGVLTIVVLCYCSIASALTVYSIEWQGVVDFKGWGCEDYSFDGHMCSKGEVGDIFGGEISFSVQNGDANANSNVGDYGIDWFWDEWSWNAINISSGATLAGGSWCEFEGGCSVSTSNGAQDSLKVSEYYKYGAAGIELLVNDLAGNMLAGDDIPIGVISLLGTNADFSVWDELGGFSGQLQSLSISATSAPIPGSLVLMATLAPILLLLRRRLSGKK